MSAEWDDLARYAEAATEGPWEAYGTTVAAMTGPGACRGCSGLVSPEHEPACYWSEIAGAGEADAEFIAAANPATILRLIAENRDLSEQLAQAYRDEVLAHDERDALAARLAAVETLADEWDRKAVLASAAKAYQDADAWTNRSSDLRAVLSAAPTDTTKETP